MITTIRKLWIVLFTVVFINIVLHTFFPHYQIFHIQRKKATRKYKYGSPVKVDIAENIKTLYNLILCYGTEKQLIDEVDLKKQENDGIKMNVLDFKYEYYFESDVDKFFDRPCPFLAPGLGPVAEDRTFKSLLAMEDVHLRIQPGGIHSPIECVAVQRVAIVVPIDETLPNSKQNMYSFLYYIHPFLMKQQLEYQIFIMVKPNASVPYRRGELYNIGFKEAQSYRNEGWDCIIFHEIHLIPLDTRNLYRCSHRPRMLIADFQKLIKFGRAVAMRPKHFKKVNGFSNYAWSNDGDFIDMYKRLIAANFSIEGNAPTIGSYYFFKNQRQEHPEPEQSPTNPTNCSNDGLSNVVYEIKDCIELKQLYTLIKIDIRNKK